jgi:hypothetical protein
MFSKGCTKENYDCCYGDKGLSDCDVRLENDYKKIMAEVKKINTFDRLQEICNAERDGRCVILPCKVGDTVYWADADGDEALELPLMGYWVTVFSDGEKKIDGCVQAFGRNWSKPFGTCLFLTREEAEKALKGGASK